MRRGNGIVAACASWSNCGSLFPAMAELERLAAAGAAGGRGPDRLSARGLPVRFGRYALLREVGRGGMGVVYQAWDRDAQRVVALKVIGPDVVEDARFRVEARVLAHLEYLYVVPLYEVGEHEGVRYFTMRSVEGGDLASRMEEYSVPRGASRQQANEDGRRIAALMAKVARAVGYFHRRGVLHRDLKPGNILIGNDGQPLVSDFGLSRRFVADSLSLSLAETTSVVPDRRLGQVVGSLGYMAPEQAEGGHDLTTAADIYSLGAILYRLLAGELPFATGSPAGLAALLDPQCEPLPPAAVNPSLVPRSDLERVCLSCLAKESAERYPTADGAGRRPGTRGERPADQSTRPRMAGAGVRVLRRRRPSSDDRTWGQVDLIDAA